MATITKERLLKIQQWRETYGDRNNVILPAEEAAELARIALASMEAVPVYQVKYGADWRDVECVQYDDHAAHGSPVRIVYTAPPAPVVIDERASFNAWNNEDNLPIAGVGAKNAAWLAWQARSQLTSLSSPVQERDRIRREHAEWSQDTFGDVGPIGPLKHLSKEALEAAAEPGDLSEWADMQFLLWDAQRRAGISDERITQAMIEKLAVNKQRQWPKPKDGEPRLHIKPAAQQQEAK